MRILLLFVLLSCSSAGMANRVKKSAEEYFHIGNQYFDKEIYDSARMYFDSTLQINPSMTDAYALRGFCYFELQRYRQAIEDFSSAVILEPGYAEAYYLRGLAYRQEGEREKACNDWEQAYALGIRKALKLIMNNCETDSIKP